LFYARLLFSGEGIGEEKSAAVHYFKLSADQGNVEAQREYGVRVARGDGIEMDKAQAARYFKLAADQGDVDAQFAYAFQVARATAFR
jgi:TPR repeat protein